MPSLRILCFGDSLTSGFCDFGLTAHPYSIALQRRLSAAFPDANAHVFTNGAPGGLVSGAGFSRRLTAECEKRPYDWVIILGGTNDLATRIPVEDLFDSLTNAWDIALLKGSKVLALTVPECHVKVPWLEDDRDLLNISILNHQERNFRSFDLKSKIPFHSLTQEERQRYWDDGVHLTPDGYDWMGDHIADALLEMLSQEIQTCQPSAKKLTAKRDEPALTEEAGHPKHINQGYVVVRKTDLD